MSALCAAETVRQDSSAGIPQKNASVSGFAAFSVDARSVEAHEYVLERCALISDLQWPLNPAVSYSVHLGIYFLNGIHFDGSFSFLQPMPAGRMTDKDFDNSRLPLPRFSLTRYSEHNCVILQGFRGMIKAGWQLPLPQTALLRRAGVLFTVEPILSFFYSAVQWQSFDGYLQYGTLEGNGYYTDWHENIPKTPFSGLAVSYSQLVLVPAIGIGTEISFPYGIRLAAGIHAAPDVIVRAEDMHYNRNLRFMDYSTGGWSVHTDMRFTWRCMKYAALFFNAGYEHRVTQEGFSLLFNNRSSTVSGFSPLGTAGAGLYGWTCSIGLALMFGR